MAASNVMVHGMGGDRSVTWRHVAGVHIMTWHVCMVVYMLANAST